MKTVKAPDTGTKKASNTMAYVVIALLLAFALRGILNFGSMSMEVKVLFVAVYATAIVGLYLIFR